MSAKQVFGCVLAADSIAAPDGQRRDAVLARLKQAVPVSAAQPAELITVGDSAAPEAVAVMPGTAAALPSVPCPARLHDGETCHATSPAVLYQEHNVVRRVRYRGLSARVGIVRGLSYRSGAYEVGRTRAPTTERIAAGTLCVTDQRLIFLSDTKNLDLPWSRLLSCTTRPGTIELSRSNSGRLIFEDVDLPALEAFEQITGTSPDARRRVIARQTVSARQHALRRRGRTMAFVAVLALAGLIYVLHAPGARHGTGRPAPTDRQAQVEAK